MKKNFLRIYCDELHLFSPYFPPNYYRFSKSLKKYGVNALGIVMRHTTTFIRSLWHLSPIITVDDLHNYEQLLRAMGYFTTSLAKLMGSTHTMSTGLKRKQGSARISISKAETGRYEQDQEEVGNEKGI